MQLRCHGTRALKRTTDCVQVVRRSIVLATLSRLRRRELARTRDAPPGCLTRQQNRRAFALEAKRHTPCGAPIAQGQMIASLPKYPYFITVPATSVIVALGSTGLALGTSGIVGGAALGLVWAISLGGVVERLMRHDHWKQWLANGSVFVVIVASGLMLGGGVMYGLLMRAAASGPVEVLSAMMQPTIPFFIILNTPLELAAVPCALFTNWHNGARRRLILPAAASFYALRIWSYVVYVPNRMAIASRPLSPSDLEWFQRSMEVDYRSLLLAIVFVGFTIAALARE
jgi:hypothetical protein